MKKILRNLLSNLNPFEDFDDDTDLFEEGIVDSLTLMGVITEFEEVTGINIPEEIVTIDNFYSVNSIISALDHIGLYEEK